MKLKKFLAVLLVAVVVLGGGLLVWAHVHVVEEGDRLWRIGQRYGVAWEELADYNELDNPHLIFPGQEIRIPQADAAETAPVATPTPAPVATPTPVATPAPTPTPTVEPNTSEPFVVTVLGFEGNFEAHGYLPAGWTMGAGTVFYWREYYRPIDPSGTGNVENIQARDEGSIEDIDSFRIREIALWDTFSWGVEVFQPLDYIEMPDGRLAMHEAFYDNFDDYYVHRIFVVSDRGILFEIGYWFPLGTVEFRINNTISKPPVH